MSDTNTGLNICVDRESISVYRSSMASQASTFFILVPGMLLAFLTGVGGAFIWAHKAGSIARRNIPS